MKPTCKIGQYHNSAQPRLKYYSAGRKKSITVLLACLLLGLGMPSCKKSSSSSNAVNVTGLFSLTGNWSTLGVNSQAALKLAASDINTYLQSVNAGFTLSVNVYDTKLDTGLAKQYFTTASNAGTHFVIGPQSSAELSAIISAADAAHTIVISQGSTAGNLAIAGDPVFRFCPPDKVEGGAIATTIYNDGIRGLVSLARNDAGNLGLQTATDADFAAHGGNVYAFAPYPTTQTDFTATIASLKTQVSQFAATYGISHTGVYLASFDEGATLFSQAVDDPVLSNVKWYGGDGIALSAVLHANTQANKFAIETGFIAPSFGLPPALQGQWQPVANRIEAITGIQADAFALSAYDAMWVIAKTLLATQGNTSNFTQLKTVFAQQANSFNGVTGSTALDSFGDRASGTFDYWGITSVDTGYQWTVMGESH